MKEKILSIANAVMQSDNRNGLKQVADFFKDEAYTEGYINAIQAIYDYSHNHRYLEKIADYFLEKNQNNIAFNYYIKYLKQQNKTFYSKFIQALPFQFCVDETRENKNPMLLNLINKNVVMCHLIIFAHSKGMYDIVMQLSNNIDYIKNEIDNFLANRVNYGDNITEIYDDYYHLSEVLSTTKNHNDINSFAIKLNPQNKLAYLNIIDDYIKYEKLESALDFYNNIYSELFNSFKVSNSSELYSRLSIIYKDLGDFYMAIYYQKLELEFELGV